MVKDSWQSGFVLSEYKCPEHGRECGLRYAVKDEKRGGFCLILGKFYSEEKLINNLQTRSE